MELQLSLRALHLAGAILWFGGTISIGLIAYRLGDPRQAEALRDVSRKLATPGMIVAWLGGLAMLALGWSGYARAGWMHGKLLLVFIASGVTGVLSARLRKWAAGEDVAVSSVRTLSFVLLGIMVLILVAVLLGPSLMSSSAG